MGDKMIEIKDLAFSYDKKPFIQDVSFSVGQGEIFGFLGPSGAGKSTLQKILTGLVSGYRGSVKVFGKEVSTHKKDFYEHIGIDFEFPTLYDKLSARRNLEFFASLYFDAHPDIEALLAGVELLRDADKPVGEYSKGMKSRLGFLRALVNDPQVLFLDEPTSGLDPSNARLMKDMIIEQKKRGKTVILTTHNMSDAAELCERVAFIVQGKIVALDTPHALVMRKGAASVRYTYTDNGRERSGECPLAALAECDEYTRAVRSKTLTSVHSLEPDLGDIFMELTGRSLV